MVNVVEVAPAISVQTVLSKTCHWMVPTFPDKVSVVVDPKQPEAVPFIVPAAEAGAIVIAPETELVMGEEQVLLTTQ